MTLARAGFNEKFLLELIKTKSAKFDTSVEGLVYLAKQGISERLVRAILAKDKADREREADGHGEDAPAHAAPATNHATSPSPVPMRVVRQRVLVPKNGSVIASDSLIVVEPRAFGDRYWALPGRGGH